MSVGADTPLSPSPPTHQENSRGTTSPNSSPTKIVSRAQEVMEENKKLKEENKKLKAENRRLMALMDSDNIPEEDERTKELETKVSGLSGQLLKMQEKVQDGERKAKETQELIYTKLGIKNFEKPLLEEDILLAAVSALSSRIAVTYQEFLELKDTENAKKVFKEHINHFNYCNKKIVEIKLLDRIIDFNNLKEINSEQKTSAIKCICIFNQIVDEIKKCSDSLKLLLAAIDHEDSRIKPKGMIGGYLRQITSATVFQYPGENFKANRNTKEQPKNWSYTEAVAFPEGKK